MATTISDATFTSTITDSITLNGKGYGNTNSSTISACNEAYERILHIPAAAAASGEVAAVCFIPILTVTAEPDGLGDVTFSEFEYARFTNLDSEYPIWIKVTDSTYPAVPTAAYAVKVDAGMSFLLPSAQFIADDADITCASILTSGGKEGITLPTSMTVQAIAHTTVCDLEMFVVTK
jgi:hypothetical protein